MNKPITKQNHADLDIEPGKPGGSPDSPHPGPFRDGVCSPCARDNIRNLEREGRAADAERARQMAEPWSGPNDRLLATPPPAKNGPRLTRAQSAQVRSLVDDGGYSRDEARALVLAGGFVP